MFFPKLFQTLDTYRIESNEILFNDGLILNLSMELLSVLPTPFRVMNGT